MIRSILLVLLLVTPAAAHDYWLMPETFTPKSGAAVSVKLYVGEAFKPEQEVAYHAKKTSKEVIYVGGRAFPDRPERKDGTKPAFEFNASKNHAVTLRVDRDWSAITLKGDKFTAYLKEEGLDEILKLRATAGETNVDGKERYRRCLKTIVFPGNFIEDGPTKAVGQVLEIVPGKHPYALKPGDELPIQLLFEEKPLLGAKVTAWHRDGDTLTPVTATTNKDGQAVLKLAKSGAWIVRTVYMRRVTEKNPEPPAEWESFWASVTFAVP